MAAERHVVEQRTQNDAFGDRRVSPYIHRAHNSNVMSRIQLVVTAKAIFGDVVKGREGRVS